MESVDATATVAVVGAGTMGAGIAQVAALAGHPVLLADAVAGRAAQAIDGIQARLARLAAKGKLDPAGADAAAQRLAPVDDVAALAPAVLVVEAIVESLEAKRALFTALEGVVAGDCVLATNTSSLSVSAIAAGLRVPGRVAGMHFFNPAPRMPLVEVVSGLDTAREVAEQVAATAAAWGKTPVHAGSTPGFIVNRVARPFYGEGLRALEERVADPATIDAVVRESGGFRMGPLELTDLIGQDVNDAVNRSVWAGFGHDPRYAPSLAQTALVDAGRLGRKTGQGFYRYGPGAPRPEPATAAAAPPPAEVMVTGDWGPWEPLWPRIQKAGVRVLRRIRTGPPMAGLGNVILVPAAGRTATELAAEHGAPVVVMDLALDPAAAGRFAVAAAHGCPQPALASVAGLLQSCGAAVSVLGDVPGLLVARTVAMLVNEAADVAGRGVATAADVDTALRLGAGYPVGPLAWGDELGPQLVAGLLDTLAAFYGDGRYRACPALRRAALTGRPLRGS